MKAGAKTTEATRILWSLVLGLGLVLGLLWVMMPRSAAEAQTDIGPGLIVEPSSAVVRDQAATDDIATMAQTSAAAPPASAPALPLPHDRGIPPDFAPPGERMMPPDLPWATGSASFFAPAGAAAREPAPAARETAESSAPAARKPTESS